MLAVRAAPFSFAANGSATRPFLPLKQVSHSCLSVYFSWRQEKYQKKRALRLGLRLPSRKRFFRRGQELARFAVLRQPARFLPEKPLTRGCAAKGGGLLLMSGRDMPRKNTYHPN